MIAKVGAAARQSQSAVPRVEECMAKLLYA
jgi:hypothetical protein